MCQDEGRREHHPGAKATGRGLPSPLASLNPPAHQYFRLIIRLLSICVMHSRTMKIASSSLTSCSVVISDVRLPFHSNYIISDISHPVHLERMGSLSEDTVRFYMAELSSALGFLHEKRIIHRDLKPDNILLDERGHAHITDFNIAVHYTERRLLTGVAGSMAYMAPEILAKRGYTYTIDWWSLGVCAYELIFGRRPFRGKTNSDLTHSISKDALRFPEDAHSKCSKAGIQALKGVSFSLPLSPPTLSVPLVLPFPFGACRNPFTTTSDVCGVVLGASIDRCRTRCPSMSSVRRHVPDIHQGSLSFRCYLRLVLFFIPPND